MGPAESLAPFIAFDAAEPFVPSEVAVTVFDRPGRSSSFPGEVRPVGDVCVEYALWTDREIGHVYELEHVWVHGRRAGGRFEVTALEASAHGGRRRFERFRTVGGRPVVYAEPGKHGMAADPSGFALPSDLIEWLCSDNRAGCEGVLVKDMFEGDVALGVAGDRAARRLLVPYAFAPAWAFDRVLDVTSLPAGSWESLSARISSMMAAAVAGVDAAPLRRPAVRWGGPGAVPETPVVTVDLDYDGGCWSAGRHSAGELLLWLRRHYVEAVAYVGGGARPGVGGAG